jgi:hypothetical protein
MEEDWMSIRERVRDLKEEFRLLSLYQRFEHVVIMVLTALIAIIVIAAVRNLSLNISFGLVLTGSLDPSDYSVFQAVFGMIFTVIIALEMIALLAVCRKVIILDPRENRRVAHHGVCGRDPCPRRCLLADGRKRSASR